MRYAIFWFLCIFLIIHWCSGDEKKDKYTSSSNERSYSASISDNYDNIESLSNSYNSNDECVEPENPYDEFSEEGHYAGFERAERTWGDCDWNSDSFNEGCEEYYEQDEAYNNCLDK